MRSLQGFKLRVRPQASTQVQCRIFISAVNLDARSSQSRHPNTTNPRVRSNTNYCYPFSGELTIYIRSIESVSRSGQPQSCPSPSKLYSPTPSWLPYVATRIVYKLEILMACRCLVPQELDLLPSERGRTRASDLAIHWINGTRYVASRKILS